MVTQIAEARTHLPQDQYVQVGSIRTRFWQVGDEGSTVVLIHGLGSLVRDKTPAQLTEVNRARLSKLGVPGGTGGDSACAEEITAAKTRALNISSYSTVGGRIPSARRVTGWPADSRTRVEP